MKKIICWILVILWMIIIFMFSSYNGIDSTKQSRGFLYHTIGNVIDFFNKDIDPIKKEELIVKIDPIVRKIAHATEYFILGLLVSLALNNYNMDLKRFLLISFIICFLYSCSDEIHQLFVFGRSGKPLDVLIDMIGATLGIMPFYFFKKSLHK